MVLEDNRLQTLALSIAESGGARALPELRTHDRAARSRPGRIDRKVEGLLSSEDLLRRGQEKKRPDAARARGRPVHVQARASGRRRGPAASPTTGWSSQELYEAFPKPMRKPHADAIRAHRLRNEILGDEGREPPRQPPRPERRARHDGGRRCVRLPQVVIGLPGGRAPARPAQAVARDRADAAAGNGPRRTVCDRCQQRARAFVRHPARDRRRDEPLRFVQDARARRPQDFDRRPAS